MPLIETNKMQKDGFTTGENLQTYCGLDCCVTYEVFEQLDELLNNNDPNYKRNADPIIYSFSRAMQAPALEMMMRGWHIDEYERQKSTSELRKEIAQYNEVLQEMSFAVWDRAINPRSRDQLLALFYGVMGLPEIKISIKGERKVSMNREVLERLELYLHARPIIACILSMRDIYKQLDVLESEVDADGRMRTSYNIAGTECIAGDSTIWTKSGLRTIKEIYETAYSCAVWNGNSFVTPVRKVKYENREGVKITLENDYYIKCSLNHPLLTRSGWIEAKDISTANSIQMNMGLVDLFGQHALQKELGEINQNGIMTEDLYELIGMWLADGSLNCNSEHYRCRFSNSDIKVHERIIFLVKRVFNKDAAVYNGVEVSFSGKDTCQWLEKLGLPADKGLGTASIKEIPAALFRGKPNLLRALLRGLTLDSHLTEKGVIFGTQSFIMHRQIQQCLLILGIKSVSLSNGNSIKLNVPRAYCGRFLSLIGFVQDEKAKKLALTLNERCQWHEPEPFGSKPFFKVTKVEPWTGDVYDLTMPETHEPQYIANGFTVHNTGRWSSSYTSIGSGTNLQNLGPAPRRMFIADPGYKIVGIDLQQTESYDVGWLCGTILNDWSYLDACMAGDLHTAVCKLIWRDLGWTGDKKKDRSIAEQEYYREYSYRYMAKRGGHSSNYLTTPWTMSRALKIPKSIAEGFQQSYFSTFACIPRWHRWVAEQLQTTHLLTTPFGRHRHFFGRANDDTTLREAVAFVPQGTTADRLNLGLWRIWKHMGLRVQLLAQVHDALYFQYREEDNVEEIIAQASQLMRIEQRHDDRTLVVPGEAKLGWNWGEYCCGRRLTTCGNCQLDANPNGMKKFNPTERDIRVQQKGLDRVL